MGIQVRADVAASANRQNGAPVGPVLHLCSDFGNNRLYTEWVRALASLGVQQVVYAAVRTERETRAPTDAGSEVRYHGHFVLKRYHRLLFRSKIRLVERDLRTCVKLEDYQLLHAHYLYSDGAVAWRIHQRIGVPYLVTVQNTDLNVFMRLRPDLNALMRKVVSEASAVVFFSPAYRDTFLARLPTALAEPVKAKAHVIPLGRDAIWFSASSPQWAADSAVLRVLYVGDFTRNKNVMRLLEASALLSHKRPLSLTLVGGGGDGAREIEAALASGRYPFATALGRVSDVRELKALYAQHDLFAMPSLTESFGLVYIEALSQGLPVLHSVGQGIAGYFPQDPIVEAVDPRSVAAIASGIERLGERTAEVRERCMVAARAFQWPRIAEQYQALYRRIGSIES